MMNQSCRQSSTPLADRMLMQIEFAYLVPPRAITAPPLSVLVGSVVLPVSLALLLYPVLLACVTIPGIVPGGLTATRTAAWC